MLKKTIFAITLLPVFCYGAAAPEPKLDPKYKDEISKRLVLYKFKSGDILWLKPTECHGAQFHEASQNKARYDLVYMDPCEWEKAENLEEIYLFDSELKDKNQEAQAKKENAELWKALKKEKLKEWRNKALEHELEIRLKKVLKRASGFLKEPIEGVNS